LDSLLCVYLLSGTTKRSCQNKSLHFVGWDFRVRAGKSGAVPMLRSSAYTLKARIGIIPWRWVYFGIHIQKRTLWSFRLYLLNECWTMLTPKHTHLQLKKRALTLCLLWPPTQAVINFNSDERFPLEQGVKVTFHQKWATIISDESKLPTGHHKTHSKQFTIRFQIEWLIWAQADNAHEFSFRLQGHQLVDLLLYPDYRRFFRPCSGLRKHQVYPL